MISFVVNKYVVTCIPKTAAELFHFHLTLEFLPLFAFINGYDINDAISVPMCNLRKSSFYKVLILGGSKILLDYGFKIFFQKFYTSRIDHEI